VSDGWVIDSSVGFAWVLPQQATPEMNDLLKDISNGALAVVPALWFVEVANGLLVLERRKKITSAERKIALQRLMNLNLTVDEEARNVAFGKTSDLAEKHGLTAYDATYLEAAIRRKLGLASRDEALWEAARRSGVKL
jgi:predicted nucleic acid-binding protein